MSKDKVLVVRKPDATIHVVPVANQVALQAHSNRLKEKWSFELMDEDEANKLPHIDPNYIKPADAMLQVKDLKTDNELKEARIKELEALLAGKNGGDNSGSQTPLNATEAIAEIKKTETVEAVNAILGADTRKTVKDAAEARIKELEAK